MLSIRQDIYRCGVFSATSAGVGVSRSAREHWQNLFANDPAMQGTKQEIHEIIAWDYANAEPITKFMLRSSEVAEIRKSQSFFFVAAIRDNGQHDVIVIQPSYRSVPDRIRDKRLMPDWKAKR